jgi:hypothetical protein
VAIRQPKRKDMIAVRRVIDRAAAEGARGAGLVDQVAAAGVPVVLRFLQGCPDLTYVALIDDVTGFHVRCSRDLKAVRKLVHSALDRRQARLTDNLGAPEESPRIALRRERVFQAIEQFGELLTGRTDLDVVLAWVVAGSNGVNLASSERMSPADAHRRLEWFTHQVLELPVDRPAASTAKSRERT